MNIAYEVMDTLVGASELRAGLSFQKPGACLKAVAYKGEHQTHTAVGQPAGTHSTLSYEEIYPRFQP